jgi:hypothetical protein
MTAPLLQLRLIWLVLLGLFLTTMASPASLAERGDFEHYALAANSAMISSPGGGLRATAAGAADLSPYQASVLARLEGYGSSAITPKRGFGLNDLAALSAKTGNEFAMFTTGGRRMIMRGDATTVPITLERAQGPRLALVCSYPSRRSSAFVRDGWRSGNPFTVPKSEECNP